ncbi:MAG: tetratricopeptide repeat protein [Polyangiales bacterium]
MLRTRVLPLALAGLTLGGCFSITSEGKRVIRETDSNTQRVTKLEQQQNAQLEQLKTAEAKAQQSITQLEGVIEQATQVVQRNSADVVTQVSELQGKVASLEGRLAELQYAIDELKKAPVAAPAPIGASSGSTPTPAPADETPADKNEHYAAAYRAYSERDFTKARTLFKSFIERYGTDAQADNAQYWIGASYLVENRPATALAELKKVIQNFRGGDAVDEALLDMAEAFYRLRACSDSRNALDTLIRTQPNSPLVSKAKAKLKDMKSLAKDYCTS